MEKIAEKTDLYNVLLTGYDTEFVNLEELYEKLNMALFPLFNKIGKN